MSLSDQAIAPMRRHARLHPEAIARVEWLFLLQAVAVVVLAYPLRFQDSWAVGLHDWLTAKGAVGNRLWDALAPYICFSYLPLIFNGALAGVPMLAMTALAGGRWLLTTPGAAPARSQGQGQAQGAGRLAVMRWASAPAFLGWVLLSTFWSPTPDVARVAAGWAALFGVFFCAALMRGVSDAERRQLAAWLVALGAVVLAVLCMEALPIFGGAIWKVMYRFDESKRNLLGSLIGHNTAAASFLLLTWFPALGLLLTARSWPGRAVLGLYLCGAIFGMLLAQSRSIWILGPILAALALRSMGRQCAWWPGRRWLPTLALAACVFGVASQAIDKPWNPLFYRNLTLARRLRDLSPRSLELEARARLNVIGVRLVPEHPFIGHGLFAFQYVYPLEQGAYFAAHPDSRLNQSPNRSNMAHDEYLQVLIDHGAIGLALLAWLGWQLARGGWRLRRAATGPGRLVREAFGWAGLAVALHAMVDFPFHVPSLLLCWTCCMAAWATRRREAVPLSNAGGHARLGKAPGIRPWALGRLVGALTPIAAVPFLATWLFVTLHGNMLYCEGNGMKASYEASRQSADFNANRDYLKSAIELYRQALRWTPANYLIHENVAQAFFYLGALERSRSERLRAADPSEAERARAEAIEDFKQASEWVVKTSAGMNYHFNYYQMAMIDRELAVLEPGRGYEQKRLAALRRCLFYCPAYTQALYDLAEGLDADGNAEEALAARRRLVQKDPALFDRSYVFVANDYARAGLYENDAAMWEKILPANPHEDMWIAMALDAELLSGNLPRARDLIRWFHDSDLVNFFLTGARLEKAMLDHDVEAAVRLLLGSHNMEPNARARFRAMEESVRDWEGRSRNVAWFTRPPSVSPAEWDRLVAEIRPTVLLAFCLDSKAAREAFDQRLAMAGPAPGAKFWMEGARIGVELGDEAFARKCLSEAKRLLPEAQPPPPPFDPDPLRLLAAKVDKRFPRP
jgi:tetratricopeptide (TPR) repeat protein